MITALINRLRVSLPVAFDLGWYARRDSVPACISSNLEGDILLSNSVLPNTAFSLQWITALPVAP
jgi:hypothetical protein